LGDELSTEEARADGGDLVVVDTSAGAAETLGREVLGLNAGADGGGDLGVLGEHGETHVLVGVTGRCGGLSGSGGGDDGGHALAVGLGGNDVVVALQDVAVVVVVDDSVILLALGPPALTGEGPAVLNTVAGSEVVGEGEGLREGLGYGDTAVDVGNIGCDIGDVLTGAET